MQAAQIKVFYIMPLPARERIYYKSQGGFSLGLQTRVSIVSLLMGCREPGSHAL